LIKWLHNNGETHIYGFDFKKLPSLDKGNEAIRRATLTNDEDWYIIADSWLKGGRRNERK